MYILDTDLLSIIPRDNFEAFNIGRRLARLSPGEVATTIITYEEQMRGWMALIGSAKRLEQQVEAYKRLNEHVNRYRDLTVLTFDERASSLFAGLRVTKLRVKSADLKIAAVCLANDATLLTRYLKDFQKVPGLRCEDWSV